MVKWSAGVKLNTWDTGGHRIGCARGELRPSDACELAVSCGKDMLYSAGRRACLCHLLACLLHGFLQTAAKHELTPAQPLSCIPAVSCQSAAVEPDRTRSERGHVD